MTVYEGQVRVASTPMRCAMTPHSHIMPTSAALHVLAVPACMVSDNACGNAHAMGTIRGWVIASALHGENLERLVPPCIRHKSL